MEPLQGSPYSKLVQLMRRHGYNKDVDIELATVTSAPPDLRIQVDHMPFELDASDLIVAQVVTDYEVTVRYPDDTTQTVTIENGLNVGDRVLVASVNEGQTYIILDRAVINDGA